MSGVVAAMLGIFVGELGLLAAPGLSPTWSYVLGIVIGVSCPAIGYGVAAMEDVVRTTRRERGGER